MNTPARSSARNLGKAIIDRKGTIWRTTGTHRRAGLLPALGTGVVTALVAALLLPGWTRSTLSDMGYWVDWATLLGLAAAAGGVSAAFAWPLLAWRHGRVGA